MPIKKTDNKPVATTRPPEAAKQRSKTTKKPPHTKPTSDSKEVKGLAKAMLSESDKFKASLSYLATSLDHINSFAIATKTRDKKKMMEALAKADEFAINALGEPNHFILAILNTAGIANTDYAMTVNKLNTRLNEVTAPKHKKQFETMLSARGKILFDNAIAVLRVLKSLASAYNASDYEKFCEQTTKNLNEASATLTDSPAIRTLREELKVRTVVLG
jgi:hypothetical protein